MNGRKVFLLQNEKIWYKGFVIVVYNYVMVIHSPYKICTGDRTFKIIDLGAAADLRVGINYIPKEFLLDPR